MDRVLGNAMERLRFRSIGEIVYEVMTGLLFYPRTLWRVLLQPAEVSEAIGEPAVDLLSPPLFLLISILLAHVLALVMRGELGGAGPVSGPDLLMFRVVAFSLFPLVMASGILKREGRPVDRATLRAPFDLQCLYAAPFAISLTVAAALARSPTVPVRPAGVALGLAAAAWYLCVQSRWLGKRLAVGGFRAFRTASWLFVVALFCCLPPAVLILGAPGRGPD